MPLMGLIEFAQKFVWLARECVEEAPGVRKSTFSSRQSIAVASLGTARIIRRKNALDVKDLVDLAVTTSPPEAMGYAEMIALRILVGDERDWISQIQKASTQKTDKPTPQQQSPQLTAYNLLLQHVLDFLDLQSSVAEQKASSQLNFLGEIESDLFSKKSEQQQTSYAQQLDMARKRTAFELAGGRQGVLDQGIDTWESLLERARQNIIQSIPSIDAPTLSKSQLLSHSDEVQTLAREEYVKTVSNILQQTMQSESQLDIAKIKKQLEKFTNPQLSSALSTMTEYQALLKRMSVSQEHYAPSLESIMKELGNEVREAAKTLDDLLLHPDVFEDQLTREDITEIMENSIDRENPLESLRKAKEIDDLLDTNFTERIYDEYRELFEGLSPDDILSEPINTTEWLETLESAMERFEQNSVWEDRNQISMMMKQAREAEETGPIIDSAIGNLMQKQVDSMIPQSGSSDELTQTVEWARDESLSFSRPDVKTRGTELGMSQQEIAQLIGDAFEILKDMIETEDPSYERVNSIMERANLSKEQISQLATASVKSGAAGALGALAASDLETVVSQVPQNDEGEELLERALGAGPGDNLLNQWFKDAASLPPWARRIVKKAAKQIMIDLAKARAAALIGSSEAGPIPEGSTRPYQLGDEADTIDLDESIDNIVIQGKAPKDVEVSDFIIRESISGRRCVVFLVDISGSMSGAPLAGASLATAMLLFAFSRDELGVALFESNSHIICEVGEPVEIDEVVDKILDLRAMGGTQMQAAVEWAEGQFVKSQSNDKMFVIASDALIGDFERSQVHMRNISDMGATSVLIVPGATYGIGNIQSMADAVNAHLVVVRDWSSFPQIVSEVLSRG